MKKYLLSFAILGLVLGGAPFVAKASTLEDLQAQISSLLQEVRDLKASLGASVISATNSSSAQSSPSSNTANIVADSSQERAVISISAFSFPKTLNFGAKNNNDVKKLQEILIRKGYLKGEASGNFLKDTREAVKSFQKENKLSPTGLVGAQTRIVLNTVAKDVAAQAQAQAPIPTSDQTPRIMYWSGKVNQHTSYAGEWLTDPDGTSGAGLDKLTYCQKFYPGTKAVKEYKIERISTWREQGNKNAWTATRPSFECSQKESDNKAKITVTSPNGGEVFQEGQQITIKWQTQNYTQERVNIFLSIPHKDVVQSLSVGVINDGTETITLPSQKTWEHPNFSMPLGLYYKIWIDNNGNGAPFPSNNNFGDNSDNLFTINKKTENKPSITILSPNGGETYYTEGEKLTINWKSENISSDKKVVIILDPSPETTNDGYNMSGSDGTLNDGVETFSIGGSAYTGKYKIRVLLKGEDYILDSSDNYFTINPGIYSPSVPTFNITSQKPNLSLSYDSARNEEQLKATFHFEVHAPKDGDARIPTYTPQISFKNVTSGSNGDSLRNDIYELTPIFSNVKKTSDSDGLNSAYIIPKGQTGLFRATRTSRPREMFAGQYYGIVECFTYYPNSNNENRKDSCVTENNKTNTVVIAGEKSPYITSITSPKTQNEEVTITGVRFNSSENIVRVGEKVFTLPSINNSTIKFIPSKYGIPNGVYFPSVKDPKYGESNYVRFEVTDKLRWVSLTSPNGGENFKVGDVMNITWKSNYEPNDSKNGSSGIFLSEIDDSGWGTQIATIVRSFVNEGTFSWTIPDKTYDSFGKEHILSSQKKYFIVVVIGPSSGGDQYSDSSDKPFFISESNKSSMSVLSPNGGQTFEKGKQMTVTWKTQNNTCCSIIPYLKNANTGTRYELLPGNYVTTVDDGNETFTLSSSIPDGQYYVVTAILDGPSDSSDSEITIKSPATASTVISRIMYWSSKVNQHFDLSTKAWATDPDGSSGATIDKLTYCKKWYPKTVSIKEYMQETISTWRASGNAGAYTSTQMSYQCVEGTASSTTTNS